MRIVFREAPCQVPELEVLAGTNLWYGCNRTSASIGASRTKSQVWKSSKWNRGA